MIAEKRFMLWLLAARTEAVWYSGRSWSIIPSLSVVYVKSQYELPWYVMIQFRFLKLGLSLTINSSLAAKGGLI